MRSLYRDHSAHLGARFRLSKATGSQRLERSLYKDLRAYLGAKFRLTANAAKSGDLILGRVGVTVGSWFLGQQRQDHGKKFMRQW